MRRWTPIAVLLLLAAGCGGGNGPGGIIPNSTDVTLQQVQLAVFTPRCAVSGCHVGPNAPFGLDLSSGQAMGNILNVPSGEMQFDRIEPLDPADSYVYMKVVGDPRIQGDPMPAFGPSLTSQQIDLLETWIEQGVNP